MTTTPTPTPTNVLAPSCPTERWLGAVDWLPPLDGPAATAERLLLLVHYGINWDGWIRGYIHTYWEHVLPERVVAAAYRSRDLRSWWTLLSRQLETAPRDAAQRRELEELLGAESRPVLVCLREKSEALLLRTRLVADAVRAARPAYTAPGLDMTRILAPEPIHTSAGFVKTMAGVL